MNQKSDNISIQQLSDKKLKTKIKEQRKIVHNLGQASDDVVAAEWAKLQSLEAELKNRQEQLKMQNLPKRTLRYFKNHKVMAIFAIILLLVIIGKIKAGIGSISESISDFVNRDRPQVYQLKGMKISEAEKLLNDNDIFYDFDGDIFDENAKDEQTVTYIIHLYSNGKEIRMDSNHRLLKGDKVTIYTDHKTKAQQEQVNLCEAKGTDYTYSFNHGQVSCGLTTSAKLRKEREVCEKEEGMVWYSDSVKCITQQEADERKAKEDEEKRKAEEEEQKRKDEELQKKQQEELRRQQEEEKRQEEERQRKEEEAKKQQEEQSQQQQETEKQEDNNSSVDQNADSPYQIPQNEVTTGVYACARKIQEAGYPKAKIEMERGYWSGYDYTWMIVGKASYKDGGWTSPYKYLPNRIVCSYNWKTGFAYITSGL